MTAALLTLLALSAAQADEPAKAKNHCEAGQTEFFGCTVKGEKVASLCGDKSALQYRFGKKDSIELSFPEKADVASFTYAHQTWINGELTAVSFTNGGYQYWLVEKLGQGEENNFQGVVVRKDGKELARLPCTGAIDGSMSSLSEALKSIGYME